MLSTSSEKPACVAGFLFPGTGFVPKEGLLA